MERKSKTSCMKKGLVLGKFMPVHKGHIALIDFALKHCDQLIILLCHHTMEPISGKQREDWLRELLKDNPKVTVYSHLYDNSLLTDSSESSIEQSANWAAEIKKLFDDVDVIFSSEAYGEYLGHFLGIEHISFDDQRLAHPVAASAILKNPFLHWDNLPLIVRPYFIKKIAILGSESTGKSSLTKILATHYNTVYVPEMARYIIGHTNECTIEHLEEIASLQAKTILEKQKLANKLLFCDTDIIITKSYSRFLFNKELIVPNWIKEANQFNLYLFLETDAAFVQDGTRLNIDERNRLSNYHKEELRKTGKSYTSVKGTWQERFEIACAEIDKLLKQVS